MSRTVEGNGAYATVLEPNRIYLGDCVELLSRHREPPVDLVFADPPFNIGYQYDSYDDSKEDQHYIDWSRTWLTACDGVLQPQGSCYIAIGDEFVADLRIIGRDLGWTLRNWIVWHYSFGQNTKSKFARAHTHILYFVKDARRFVFHDEQVRFPSARHTEYSDKRANPLGRVPDDVWDEFPRVCGTFQEREGWHGCQMPEALLMRIIRASSNPGDLVLDPFVGSGTTVVSAAKLGRRYIGIDVSKEYIAQTRHRLGKLRPARQLGGRNHNGWPEEDLAALCALYRETNTAWERLIPNDVAMDCFTRCLNNRLDRSYPPADVVDALRRLAADARLPRLRNDRPYRPRAHRHGGPALTHDFGPLFSP